MANGKARPEAQSLPAARLRLRKATEIVERVAEIIVRVGIVGLEAYCFSVARLRLRKAAETVERGAEVVVRLGIGGLDRDGMAKGICGLAEPA